MQLWGTKNTKLNVQHIFGSYILILKIWGPFVVRTPPRRGSQRLHCRRATQVLKIAHPPSELYRAISMTAPSSSVHPSLFSNEPYSSARQVHAAACPSIPSLIPLVSHPRQDRLRFLLVSDTHCNLERISKAQYPPPSPVLPFASCSLLSLAASPRRSPPLTLQTAC
jgi:hypothetical protein